VRALLDLDRHDGMMGVGQLLLAGGFQVAGTLLVDIIDDPRPLSRCLWPWSMLACGLKKGPPERATLMRLSVADGLSNPGQTDSSESAQI
jgi:hypothetical protein